MIVAIDDQRPCLGADVVIRTYASSLMCLKALAKDELAEPITELWLDHDLGDGVDIRPLVNEIEQSMQCGDWAFESLPAGMKIRILSDNPAGRVYIRQALEKYFEVLP